MEVGNYMEKIDQDGLILCDLQAKTFEMSIDYTMESSGIFIRRFMNSHVSKMVDNKSLLDTNLQPYDILEMIEEEYQGSNYGSKKYTKNEMYWIGYIYRYFSYTYDFTSRKVYKIVKPKELQELFLPYHTLDPSQAIERILEAKGMLLNEEEELQRQYEIFKKIRENK